MGGIAPGIISNRFITFLFMPFKLSTFKMCTGRLFKKIPRVLMTGNCSVGNAPALTLGQVHAATDDESWSKESFDALVAVDRAVAWPVNERTGSIVSVGVLECLRGTCASESMAATSGCFAGFGPCRTKKKNNHCQSIRVFVFASLQGEL